jgi:ABC-type glutathione transport system ATPase component
VQTRKEVLQAEWHNTAKDYDLSNLQNTKENTIKTETTTKDLINHSISILTEKESAFTKENLLKQTLINNIEKGVTITEVEKEIQNMLKERTIIQVFQNNKTKKDGILYTTKQEIHRELQLIKHLETDTKNKQIFTSKEELQNQIHKNDNIKDKYNLLTDGQKEAVNHILISKEQIIGIQGSAGTGKTYMLNITRELLQERGKEFIALAPSSSATKLLKDDANIPNNNTLQHFLMRYQRYQNPNNDKTADDYKEYFYSKEKPKDYNFLLEFENCTIKKLILKSK